MVTAITPIGKRRKMKGKAKVRRKWWLIRVNKPQEKVNQSLAQSDKNTRRKKRQSPSGLTCFLLSMHWRNLSKQTPRCDQDSEPPLSIVKKISKTASKMSMEKFHSKKWLISMNLNTDSLKTVLL